MRLLGPDEDLGEFWESFYRERDQVWSGAPNPLLVREVADLTAGTALDLGCGEGGDAIWLAEEGWQVVGADVSPTVLGRAAAHAAAAGVSDRVDWQQHDLARTFPEGTYDLVSAQFFHTPLAHDAQREVALRRAADAVAPGGTLLVAGHAGWPSWAEDAPTDVHLPTTAEVLASLELDPDAWVVELEEVVERVHASPDGEHGTRLDNVLRVRRLP